MIRIYQLCAQGHGWTSQGRTSVSLATYALLQKGRQATGLGASEEILGLWIQDMFLTATLKQSQRKHIWPDLNPFTAKEASFKQKK